jgi:CBS domain-containing protein
MVIVYAGTEYRMVMYMLVKDVMNREVKTIEPGESMLEAAKMMNEFRTGCLVVVRDTRLVGIVTERDIMEKVVAEDRRASEFKVSQVMTRDPVMIEDDKDISEAVEVMSKSHVKKLPVISDHKLVGILTAADLARVQPELIKQISALMVFPKKGRPVAG